MTKRTADEAGDDLIFRHVDTVRVKGRAEAVQLYQLLAERSAATGRMRADCAAYAEALSIYRRRDGSAARLAFEAAAERFGDDETARLMALRCTAYAENDPGPNWDGVFVLDAK